MTLVNTVLNFWVPYQLWGISQLAENQLASQNGLYSMELQSISGNNMN